MRAPRFGPLRVRRLEALVSWVFNVDKYCVNVNPGDQCISFDSLRIDDLRECSLLAPPHGGGRCFIFRMVASLDQTTHVCES